MTRPGAGLTCCAVLVFGLSACAQAAGSSTTVTGKVTLKRIGSAPVAGSPVRLRVDARLRRGRFVTRHTVSYGDATLLRRGTGRPRQLRHTYARAGRYRVALTLVDNLRRRTVGRLWITVRGAPVAPPPPPAPVLEPPPPPPPVFGIAAGNAHACILLAPGSVHCVGSGAYGQLGNGTPGYNVTPSPVTGITNAIAIATGANHSCALLTGGSISCWGDGGAGQLGDGRSALSPTPVPVREIVYATAIAAGGDHTCALLASGSVACWGQNIYGQLGNGSGHLYGPTPTAVAGITNATAIAAGGVSHGAGHSCAVLASGHVSCWGAGGRGELGDGGLAQSATPVQVSTISDAVAVAAGAAHSCAVLAGGRATCWGSNTHGQLGSSGSSHAPAPVPVDGLANVIQLAAGGATVDTGHTCALVTGGQVWCWGRGESNGFASRTFRPAPVPVNANAIAVAAGGNRSCALLLPLNYRCWGPPAS